MSEEILINVTPQETRVAVIENGVLHETYIERTRKRGLVGNIFKGRVSRVLPGMQAAFIDIGLERTGFLHTSDIVDAGNLEGENIARDLQETSIEKILTENQEILVQVIKDPLGTKGARLTTRLSIPSRFMVFIPDYPIIGISQRIEDEEERERLRQLILQSQTEVMPLAVGAGSNVIVHNAKSYPDILKRGGFIARTAAEGITEANMQKDINYLHKLWESIDEQVPSISAPDIVYEDLPLAMRVMRDMVHDDIESILIDSKETFDKAVSFTDRFTPEFKDRVEYYSGERPILDLHSAEDEIQKALNRKVPLKSGGHLVIDQTEAMSTVDVNTGAFVGYRNQEETIYKTNLEASQSIARQLRLRNLGGIIIIDFIDMEDPEHARQVIRSLEKNLEKDHTKVGMSELTSLGLVQLTRKRTRESLEHILCDPCPTCNERGTIKSQETVCYEVFREILREVKQFDAKKLLVVASQSVVDMCLHDESKGIADLEKFIDRPISFQIEPLYSQEQYDIVLL
jgi:ribonuclease G